MTTFARDAEEQATMGGERLSRLLESASVTTPVYVYDLSGMQAAACQLTRAFGGHAHLIAYAVKANSAGSVVRTFAQIGLGACLVSGAELRVALGAGVAPTRMVMNGVAKSDRELDLAISQRLYGIQAESVEELQRIAARARALASKARVALRINPGVEIDSHSHIATGHDAAKFGIAREDVALAFERVEQYPAELECVGVSTHVGSMLYAPEAYLESAQAVCEIARARLSAGKRLEYINFGGGYGVNYGDKSASAPGEFASAALGLAERAGLQSLTLVVEPGRSLVGPYAVLVASVIQPKQAKLRHWLAIDAGMNDLLRPALYGARHRIEPLERAPGPEQWRVVGPICESSDDFGFHSLGEAPERVVIRDVGGYGFVMASEYNGRALPSEVFVRDGKVVNVSRSPGSDAWVERRLRA